MVQAPDGAPQFHEMMTRLTHRCSSPAVTFVAFDVLIDNGQVVARLPNHERHRRLQQRARTAPSWYVPDHAVGHGAELLVEAVRRGLERVVLKRVDSA